MNRQAIPPVNQHDSSASPADMRRIEVGVVAVGIAVTVTLALTVESSPSLSLVQSATDFLTGPISGNGPRAGALVVLFDVYAIWQHLQLQAFAATAGTASASARGEKYRRSSKMRSWEFFRPLRKVVRSVSTARWRKCTATILQNNAAEVSNMTHQLFVDPGRMDELTRALNENGVVRSAEVEVYRRDRAKKWLLVNLRAVRDEDGNVDSTKARWRTSRTAKWRRSGSSTWLTMTL